LHVEYVNFIHNANTLVLVLYVNTILGGLYDEFLIYIYIWYTYKYVNWHIVLYALLNWHIVHTLKIRVKVRVYGLYIVCTLKIMGFRVQFYGQGLV
jgi:hypothetical protein